MPQKHLAILTCCALWLLVAFACGDGSDLPAVDGDGSEADQALDGDGADGDAPLVDGDDAIDDALGAPPSGAKDRVPTSLFVKSTPWHEQAIGEMPDEIALEFDAALGPESTAAVYLEKKPVSGPEDVSFDDDRRTMRIAIHPDEAIGVIEVLFLQDGPNGLESGYFAFYVEMRAFEGTELDSIANFRENSIKGPQYVSLDDFQFVIDGLVENPQTLSYAELLALADHKQKVAQLNCVEGWHAKVLWEGVAFADIMELVEPSDEAAIAILYGEDGYTTSMRLEFLSQSNILLSHKMNGVTLPGMRGFPFQLAAVGKWGYKWIKWVKRIEFSADSDYHGTWESAGFSNTGDWSDPFYDRVESRTRDYTPYGCTLPARN